MMKRHFALALAFLFFGIAWTGCTFTKKIRTGEQAFEVKQYAVAAQILTEEYRKTSYLNEKARKAFLIASSYERMNRVEDAAQWYQLADEHNFGPEALEKYAAMLKRSQRYGEALNIYRKLADDNQNALRYRQLATACQLAYEWWTDQGQSLYRVGELPVNTPASEYAPFVMAPDVIAFSSDRPQSTGDEVYTWTGNHFSDLFLSDIRAGTVESFDPGVNTKDNEGTAIVNRDGTEMYFTRCFSADAYDSYCKLMFSRRRGAGWTTAEPLPFQEEEVNYGHPFLSENDSILFYSSNDPAGAGGYDLYYSLRTDKGWSEPVLMSGRINTEGNEKFPSVHRDTLYFASDGHLGMGGLDVFRTYPLSDGNWAPPENLKPPVNSGWDDFAFVVDTFARLRGDELQKGYFTSARNTGMGNDDIFSYTKIGVSVPADDTTVVADRKPQKPKQYRIYLALKVSEPVLEDPENPNSRRIGTAPLPGASVIGEDGPMATSFTTDGQGYLIIELEYEKDYIFRARYPDHFNNALVFSTVGIEKDPEEPTVTINRELILEPIIRNTEIVLENVYYDLDKWNIREDAKPVLDSLVTLLKQHPEINIELGSHTDCRNTDEYNMDLSRKRAQSAMLYLSMRGIQASRLSSVGYGESRPAVDCVCEQCTEEQHQANRRTTFKIVN